MKFLEFVVSIALAGILIAVAGLIMFARYKKFDEKTGGNHKVQKIIAWAIFAIGMLVVISPTLRLLGIVA